MATALRRLNRVARAVDPGRLTRPLGAMTRSSKPEKRRSVYVGVAVFYTALFFALIWPVYPRFATIAPRILGVPFSLAYVVGALLLSFAGLLCLYLWER